MPESTAPEREKNSKKSIASLHLAVALFGLSGVIAKYVTWSAIAVTFGRVLSSSVVLLIFMLIRREKIKLDCRRDYIIIIIAGVIMAVHWATFFQSIQVSSVAIGTITFSAFPLFVTFLEPVIYKEKRKTTDVIAACVMLIGVFITIPEFSLGNSTTVGIIWGMIGSFTYAVMSLMNRHLSSSYPGRQICFYEQGIAMIVLLPLMFFADFTSDPKEICLVLIMGVLCTAVAHSIFVGSLRNVRVQTAGIISGMETVYGIIFAMILLGNMISVRELIGGAVILLAAAWKTVKSQ